MPRHSRNNTNGASFTYAERQMLGSGTKSERLGRDSMKNFDACSLCLERAREPRSCPDGHIFCQECIVTSLLSQKSDIKRQQLLLERMREAEVDELAAARMAARERVLQDFDRAQSGLSKSTRDQTTNNGNVFDTSDIESKQREEARLKKRKFDLDEDEVDRLAEQGVEKALKKIAIEMAEARKAKLPNFWLPSLTPNSTPDQIVSVKLQTLCHVTKPAHPVSLKTLTVVKFEEEISSKAGVSGGKQCICPVCRKSLTNNVQAYVLKPCGDVVCKTCLDTLCKPEKQCAKCGIELSTKGLGYIELKREGTGFAAGGVAEAKRYDLPFQG